MPQRKAMHKSLRQSMKRRDANRAVKKTMRLAIRGAVTAAAEAPVTPSTDELKAAYKAIDKAAKKGVIHKDCADRKKARMMKRINAAQS